MPIAVLAIDPEEAAKYYWQPCAGARHVYLAPRLAHGSTATAMCGNTISVGQVPKDQWLWPTCAPCDRKIRDHLGIPQFSPVLLRGRR